MEFRLDGKRALITGGSLGLGKGMAEAFTQAGAHVMIAARNADRLEACADDMASRLNRAVQWCAADVSTPDGCEALYAAAEEKLGGVDILINNAGTAFRGPFEELTDADWQADFDLKVFAAIRLCRLAIPGMRARQWGRIMNVVSIGGKAPEAGAAPTVVSRAAGIALSKSLAGEVAKDGITVNALCTGKIVSAQWVRNHKKRAPEKTYEEFMASVGAAAPIGRMGQPEEFAAMAQFLASPAASYITGTAINIDGGLCPVV